MLRARSRRKPLGVTLIEVMAVTAIMGGLQSQSAGNLRYGITKAREIQGISNLRQIHMILMMQSMTGRLPNAALYPKGDPRTDPKSIMRLMRDVPAPMWVSPFAPEPLRKKGLTFAWNSAVNGKSLDAMPGNTWLLMDLAAFIADPKVNKPHKYLILYANGRSEAVANVPPDVERAVKAAKAKLTGKSPGAKPKTKRKTESPKPPTRRRGPGGILLPNVPGL